MSIELFSEGERKLYKLLFDEGKSVSEVVREMNALGYDYSKEYVLDFKRRMRDALSELERKEFVADNVVESVKRANIELNDILDHTKKLLERVSGKCNTFEEILVIRELTNQMKLILKAQGRLNSSINLIGKNQINIVESPEFMNSFRVMLFKLFSECKAELVDGKLVLNSPTPELVDDFFKWRDRVGGIVEVEPIR